ncbi:MAG: ABC-F family ATP-binding cassette domain-containing protein [Alphaproteobacteria bacterium]|nr:ABC-F family ATP-binding cassette domain-containing protein [Alphaproteobacteria bacterium]
MIDITNISLRFGNRVLFNEASAHISDGQKVGIVGLNGCGKTTLLKIIIGSQDYDDGEIKITKGQKIVTIAQEIPASNTSLIDFILNSDTERKELLEQLEIAEKKEDGIKISEIHERLNSIQAYSAEAKASQILYGLGFSENDQHRPISDFSGGQRRIVALASALFVHSDILLLDEPTNHLDLESTLWLENYLTKYPNTLLLISHDRHILNSICNNIINISNNKFTLYGGNYDSYEQTKALQEENLLKQAKKEEEKRQHLQEFINRFQYKATKAKQAQSRIKQLEKLGNTQIIVKDKETHFSFIAPSQISSPIYKIENGSTGYGEKIVLSKLNLRIDADDRIALIGENGNGKSTFAKLLVGNLNLFEGDLTKSNKLEIGYYAQHQTEELNINLTPVEQMQSVMPNATQTEIRSHLGRFALTQDKAETKIELLSGGEKARLLLAMMSKNSPHLLILDEPTNHLDIDARNALIDAINSFTGAVILITHDLSLIELTVDKLWRVKNGTIKEFDGDLEDYRNLLLTDPQVKKVETQQKKDNCSTSRKDERRISAEKRAALAPLKKKLKEIENKMEKLTDKQAEIENLLEDPTVYMFGMNAAKVNNMKIALAQIEEELTPLEEEWIELSSQIEEAEKSI